MFVVWEFQGPRFHLTQLWFLQSRLRLAISKEGGAASTSKRDEAVSYDFVGTFFLGHGTPTPPRKIQQPKNNLSAFVKITPPGDVNYIDEFVVHFVEGSMDKNKCTCWHDWKELHLWLPKLDSIYPNLFQRGGYHPWLNILQHLS